MLAEKSFTDCDSCDDLGVQLLQTRFETKSNLSKSAYSWPSGRGRVGQYGTSRFVGPKNLTADFAWSWHHPEGKYHTLPYGTAMDHVNNIYLTTDTSMWKLSPSGEVIWNFTPNPRATIFSASSLLDGRVHFTTLDGRMWAVSMETGKELWSKKICKEINQDNGFVSAHDGVVIAATDASDATATGRPGLANKVVRAVKAEDGSPLWAFKPEMPIWNFLALFPDDGTVLYQDWEGKAYRHHLRNGSLIWSAGGHPGTWTDGSPLVADGVAYLVSANVSAPKDSPEAGHLAARRISDGSLLWEVGVPMPPNNAPSIGRLAGHGGLLVMQPGGWQGEFLGPTGIFGFDAHTGKQKLHFRGPAQSGPMQAGALEGWNERTRAGASPSYITNPWSAPSIDKDGTLYVGHENGIIYALRDTNGDGKFDGATEVSTFQTGAAFVGSSSPAHGPGMMAIASCDTLFVFKTTDN
eukprot:TRINITY_DN89171_c0_g1_i1.p1 TRINITY_DN89171_c0_g1~~TRINITY_DN89171_c0_g1_i1.p1  ORF type:complete len:499 (+),score=46.89 TRINITY_DN89171_c0_g1_i1:100-1497(+)